MPPVVCLVIALSGSAHAADAPRRDPRVRPLDSRLVGIVDAGRHRSPTFRSLLDRLEEGDVVVYLQLGMLPAGLLGRLTFLSAVPGRRYVMVELARQLDMPRMTAMVGHELQHAVEILDADEIVDTATLGAAYERWGSRRRQIGNGRSGFDTPAAIRAGRQVWRELADARITLATR